MTFTLPTTRRRLGLVAVAGLVLAVAFFWPDKSLDTLGYVLAGLAGVAPAVGVGLVVSAWVAASGAGEATARLFRGRTAMVIVGASAIGAVTPVCGVTVLPLMAGLLASGVPLAPVMAFWLSSPVTDPGLFAATWAILGPGFAIAKTLAAFGLGLLGGAGTAALGNAALVRDPLRPRRLSEMTASAGDPPSCRPAAGFSLWIWREPSRMRVFRGELLWMTKLVVACLAGAFAAEHLLRGLFPPEAFAAAVGIGSPYAIPLAVTIGAPLYVDGYAALPLTRGLLDLGMSPGAAFAFLVSGSAVSIWGVLAVIPVLRAATAALLVGLALVGSLATGYVFEMLWPLLP